MLYYIMLYAYTFLKMQSHLLSKLPQQSRIAPALVTYKVWVQGYGFPVYAGCHEV